MMQPQMKVMVIDWLENPIATAASLETPRYGWRLAIVVRKS